jgi:predicted transcriptional regulator
MIFRRDRQRGEQAHGEQRYLGELQSEIMELAWSRGALTAREVLAELQKRRPIAYTTVRTVMERLVEQGVLARQRQGSTSVYRPARTREQFRAAVSGAIVDDLVADFGEVALAQFADALERTDPALLARLRALVAAHEATDDGA